ncbi:MAG: hypothetical protein M3Z43_00520 [Bifidobacterium sp.]|uniref:hypothetical protein n=1 Tax=Bifidobacterium apicola TaxID=3230739 RepID=UPI0036F3A11E|nr:hypothetical protein [Bifidobacterium sp.]
MATKVTIGEALSPYSQPVNTVHSLMVLADRIDKAASRCGSTELTARECFRPLGLNTVIEFRGLQAEGLMVYRRGENWCLDSRQFRRWVNDRVAEIQGKTSNQPSSAFGQQQLFQEGDHES